MCVNVGRVLRFRFLRVRAALSRLFSRIVMFYGAGDLYGSFDDLVSCGLVIVVF